MKVSGNRPDFSDLLAHFTADRDPLAIKDGSPVDHIKGMSAFSRLVAILEAKKIIASPMPWTGRLAACFTECPWSSLMAHAEAYSPYGVGFMKPHVFAAGGGPVYYVRADHFEKQKGAWAHDVYTFVTPFWPAYIPKGKKDLKLLGGKPVDYTHEREWRVPHDFKFEYSQVAFVIVKSYEDMAKFPKGLKDSIGREKFLMMDIYKQIEALWPVHKM